MFLTAPVLTYDVNTVPFPLLASAETGNLNKATFTALATNGTGGDVVLEGIVVQLPVGSDASTLTLDPSVIGPVAPLGWTLASTQTPPGLVQFVFQPQAGHSVLPKGQSLPFVFNNIEVNRTPGTFAVAITEGSGNCVPPDCPVYPTHITKFPNGWGQVSFWVSPANIPYQGNTTLFWSGPQGATYTIQYMANGKVVNIPAQGDPPLGNNGQYPGQGKPALTLETTTVFTMNVAQSIDNQEFHAQQQVTVSVGPPPPPIPKISKFHGSVAMDRSQLQLTLSWITERADQITITGVPGLQPTSGEMIIRPSTNDPLQSSYTLEARSGQNKVTSTVSFIWTENKRVPVGEYPTQCAILPDGSRLFCTSYLSNKVWTLDPVKLTNLAGPFGVFRAYSIKASPDDACVYVTEGPPDCKLSGYDPITFKAVSGSPAPTGTLHRYLAVTPDSKRIYVSGGLDEGVLVFEASRLKQVAKVNLARPARGVAFTPDGSRAFVAMGQEGVVSVIDTEKLIEIKTIPVSSFTFIQDVAVTPDDKQLYVADSDSVRIFDPVTFQQFKESPIRVSGLGYGAYLEPSRDGRLMFVLGASLSVIDTTTRTLVGSSRTFCTYSTGLAVSPDGLRVFVVAVTGIARDSNAEMLTFLPAAIGGIG
jgi:DNA-binding beta-propeller fold protein YncE